MFTWQVHAGSQPRTTAAIHEQSDGHGDSGRLRGKNEPGNKNELERKRTQNANEMNTKENEHETNGTRTENKTNTKRKRTWPKVVGGKVLARSPSPSVLNCNVILSGGMDVFSAKLASHTAGRKYHGNCREVWVPHWRLTRIVCKSEVHSGK